MTRPRQMEPASPATTERIDAPPWLMGCSGPRRVTREAQGVVAGTGVGRTIRPGGSEPTGGFIQSRRAA